MKVIWSGFFTPYDSEQVKNNATTPAGVYLLWVKLKNDKWRCFYAGQASNIYGRLQDHLSDEEDNECIKNNVSEFICGFEYADLTKQSSRDGIEKFLYDHYNPECNKIDPGGAPIAVNLP